MKNTTKICMFLVGGGVMFAILSQTAEAEASHWRHKHDHHKRVFSHHHRHYPRSQGEIVFSLPEGFIKISVGSRHYHYRDGEYYRKSHFGYTTVPAPVGACLTRLPYGHQKIYVDGSIYYTYNDVYYKHRPEGYVVIEKPYSRYTKKSKDEGKVKHFKTEDSITINIPNRNGSYTAVIIQQTENGFIGPQGEFYDEFPRVEQLKTIYGNSLI